MKEKVKEILYTYVCVVSCVTLVAAIFITIFWRGVSLGVEILWQIQGVSALCCLGNFLYPNRELSKREMLIRKIVYYFYCNAVVISSGLIFGWFYIDNLGMMAGMLVLIAIVYLAVLMALQYRDKQLADKLNRELGKFRGRGEE